MESFMRKAREVRSGAFGFLHVLALKPLGGLAQSLDDLVLGEGATFGCHVDDLGPGDFACLDFDCFDSIEFFKRRTDACFTAVSSDAGEVGNERGRAGLLLCAKQGGVCAQQHNRQKSE